MKATIPILILILTNPNILLVVRKIGLVNLKNPMLATKRLLNVGLDLTKITTTRIVKL